MFFVLHFYLSKKARKFNHFIIFIGQCFCGYTEAAFQHRDHLLLIQLLQFHLVPFFLNRINTLFSWIYLIIFCNSCKSPINQTKYKENSKPLYCCEPNHSSFRLFFFNIYFISCIQISNLHTKSQSCEVKFNLIYIYFYSMLLI